MSNNVNLVTFAKAVAQGTDAPLEVLRLDTNETIAILFTAETARVSIHYCDDDDIRGYVHCNKDKDDDACALCDAGLKPDERLLLPVYIPTARNVSVLPVPTSFRPNALLPQLAPLLEASNPLVAFLRREGSIYKVDSAALRPELDDGAAQIAEFQRRLAAGELNLGDVYRRLANKQLEAMPAVKIALAYRRA